MEIQLVKKYNGVSDVPRLSGTPSKPHPVGKWLIGLWLLTLFALPALAESHPQDSIPPQDSVWISVRNDTLNQLHLQQLRQHITQMDSLRYTDSLAKEALKAQLEQLRTTDNLKKEEILEQLEGLRKLERERLDNRIRYIDSLRHESRGYPVLGVLGDTITTVYIRQGSFTPQERAERASKRIRHLYEQDFSEKDSLTMDHTGGFTDIMFGEYIITSISDNDALWVNTPREVYAETVKESIINSVLKAREETSFQRILIRIGLVVLTIVVMIVVIALVSRLFRWLKAKVQKNKEKLFKDLSYNDYTFVTVDQEASLAVRLLTILHWVTVVVLFIFILPVIFSIFPFSRGWSDQILEIILDPIHNLLVSIWKYLPNLVNIFIIVFVMKHIIHFVKYIFSELERNRLKISGFHPEFARPTFVIVRALLIVFGIILIFPFLPGSGSEAFNAVSVFIGLLVSLGASSAISNLIAGLVITYMRPFKVGDRIKIDGLVGDVTEKGMLVTKIKQVTNEEVTIPNSKVLNNNTINYSALADTKGLILSTTVTFGYEVPWRKVEEILIEAISRCELILPSPKPFVLQMSLDDFYITYTINGYTIEANKQAGIYSQIRGHIQDVCREHDIELLSPYYQANRDGNERTVPPEYTPRPKKEQEKPVPKVHGEED